MRAPRLVTRTPVPSPGARRRRLPLLGGALLAAAVATAAVLPWGPPGGARPHIVSAAAGDGPRHTAVEASPGGCGRGWTRPRPGQQVLDLRNTSTATEDVYLTDPATGAVYGEVEGLAPGVSRPLRVTLGNGGYAVTCVPDDSDAVTGPTVRVTGASGPGSPAVLPVTQQDLIPPTLAYQRWTAARLTDLLHGVARLRDDIDRADLAAARTDWLAAHLVYERMGAAYGAFGDADREIDGTAAGLAGGVGDPGFTGFHRLELGLWHGGTAASLRGPADRLARDVRALRAGWPRRQMDPAELGLRAHEILEDTLRSELTGRTDYGSATGVATARANLDGTRVVLHFLRPLLRGRYRGLAALDGCLDRTRADLDAARRGGRWTPLARLGRSRRERLDADLGRLLERLADVAAVTAPRRTG